jgi:hypothetical protein
MKRTKTIICAIVAITFAITLGTLLSTKAFARKPNCTSTVGNITLECYGPQVSICFTVYDNGTHECKGTEVVIFHPDDPN